MSIIAVCHCGAKFSAIPQLAGKQVRCPTCGQMLQVPGPASEPVPEDLGLTPVAQPQQPQMPQTVAPQQQNDHYDELEVVEDRYDNLETTAQQSQASLAQFALLRTQQFFYKASGRQWIQSVDGDLFDRTTQQWLGKVQERAEGIAKFLQWVVPKAWLPMKIEVLQGQEKSLVFTIWRPAFFKLVSRRIDITDSAGVLVAYLYRPIQFSFELDRPIFQIFTANDVHVANAKLLHSIGNEKKSMLGMQVVDTKFRLAILTPADNEMGHAVNEQWAKQARFDYPFKKPDNYTADIGIEMQNQPLSKLLVLATMLSFEMYRQDARRAGKRPI